VAICFLHSYANPRHEAEAKAVVTRRHPSAFVTVSSEVAPEIREYERTSSVVVNAYIGPLANGYLKRLRSLLDDASCTANVFMMLSTGGVCTLDVARQFPIRLVESGPAAGALVGSFFGRLSGRPNVVAFDMGGTTAKACVVESGEPRTTYEFEVARVHRFMKGSGLPIKTPTLDLIEIGAGGGSIASINTRGLLEVGPESAGAMPGPACYGRGGDRPTVTDADLLLGYLNPDYFLGGAMRLDVEAAARVVAAKVAGKLGLDTVDAAWAIHEVVNENMASAVRIYLAERGLDPRDYALVATGGAGPLHAGRLAEKLHMRTVICPLAAGVASTIGMLVTPARFEVFRSYVARFSAIDWAQLNALLEDAQRTAADALQAAGVAAENIHYTRSVDARYVGQGYEIEVRVPPGRLNPSAYAVLVQSFQNSYAERFGRLVEGVECEAITWRVIASGPTPDLTFVSRRSVGEASSPSPVGPKPDAPSLKGHRTTHFGPGVGYTTPVFDRYKLEPGERHEGPAVIEEKESTVIVGLGSDFTVDDHLSVIVDVRR
jgi:N-methylhydantoinase A